MHKMLLLSTEEHLVIVVKLEDHPQGERFIRSEEKPEYGGSSSSGRVKCGY
jgi:hypothetical protein